MTLKKKMILPIMATMMGIAAAFAFTDKPVENAVYASHFKFTGPSATASEYLKLDNWENSSGQESCTGQFIPCELEIDDTSITSPEQLVDLLNTMDQNNEDVEGYVEGNAIGFRN